MDLVIDFNYLGLILNKLCLFQKAKKKQAEKDTKASTNFFEKKVYCIIISQVIVNQHTHVYRHLESTVSPWKSH